ncbi:MAG: tetratricopeptide repeat protein [Gemmatimonadota bacterium]|nr:MAG: tetratricopeptide repeat protein [Gemmatimonadota bacterium]
MYGYTACLLAGALLVGSSPQGEGVGLQATQPTALAAPTASLASPQEAPPSSAVPFGHRIAIASQHLGETRDLLIRLPRGYADEGGPNSARYPVLYVLDGGDYFEPFGGVVQYLTMYDMVPELIVVAIPHGDRMKELTFSPSNEENGDWPTSGGAESFQRFLEEELIPVIDESYRTYPFRILVGHSLAGLFALESLARSPDLFQATIALDPSLYWNQFEWLKNAATLFDGVSNWRHFLFISGERKDEEETRRLAEFQSLVEARAPEGFEYHYACYPEENHASVGLPGFYQDLKQLFAGWQTEGEWWSLGPDKVRAHFRGLSDRYGFSVPIPEDLLVGHALHGLHRHEAPDEAILLLELCLSLYPESADAYEGLGEAYERKGDRDQAEKHYLKALEIDPGHELAKERLEALGGM